MMELQDVQVVAEGLGFPEGPIALAGRVRAGGRDHRPPAVTHRVRAAARTTVADLGGGPNGAAIGPDGAVYVCNNGGMTREQRIPGCIQRVELDTGRHDVLYTSCDGVPLQSPNDLVFDASGGFWFTDLGEAPSSMRHPRATPSSGSSIT